MREITVEASTPMRGSHEKPRTAEQCGQWAYVDGDTLVCSKPGGHEGGHSDADADRSWTTPFDR